MILSDIYNYNKLTTGDIVLINNQFSKKENGIYIVKDKNIFEGCSSRVDSRFSILEP